MITTAGLILAGGRSRRMGRDKALLPLPGTQLSTTDTTSTFMTQQVAVLSSLCETVLLVARDREQAAVYTPYLPSSLDVVLDQQPDVGPLMGLYSGLSALATLHVDCALVTSVDMPLLQVALLRWLLTQASVHEVIMPVVNDVPQVLLALYPCTILDRIAERLQEGRRDPRSLLAVTPVRYIAEAQLRHYDPQLRSFVNVNTPEELSALDVSDPHMQGG